MEEKIEVINRLIRLAIELPLFIIVASGFGGFLFAVDFLLIIFVHALVLALIVDYDGEKVLMGYFAFLFIMFFFISPFLPRTKESLVKYQDSQRQFLTETYTNIRENYSDMSIEYGPYLP